MWMVINCVWKLEHSSSAGTRRCGGNFFLRTIMIIHSFCAVLCCGLEVSFFFFLDFFSSKIANLPLPCPFRYSSLSTTQWMRQFDDASCSLFSMLGWMQGQFRGSRCSLFLNFFVHFSFERNFILQQRAADLRYDWLFLIAWSEGKSYWLLLSLLCSAFKLVLGARVYNVTVAWEVMLETSRWTR